MMRDRFANRFIIGLYSVLCILYSTAAHAVTYESEQSETRHSAQLRVGVDYTKKWRNGLSLQIGEELRFPMYTHLRSTTLATDSTAGPAFGKSYTTVSLGYKPIQYLKFDAGYALRILGDKDWTNVHKWLRHRVFFGVTGSYKYENWSFSLRERFLTDIRTDAIDQHTATGLYEKNRADWQLRSRLGVAYHVQHKPVKPYLWVELENTLNAPEYQRKGGHQFLSTVRTQAGVKWRLTKLSSLDFFYRFQYGYDRDINITKGKGYIQLTEQTAYLHAIGVIYNLDW